MEVPCSLWSALMASPHSPIASWIFCISCTVLEVGLCGGLREDPQTASSGSLPVWIPWGAPAPSWSKALFPQQELCSPPHPHCREAPGLLDWRSPGPLQEESPCSSTGFQTAACPRLPGTVAPAEGPRVSIIPRKERELQPGVPPPLLVLRILPFPPRLLW